MCAVPHELLLLQFVDQLLCFDDKTLNATVTLSPSLPTRASCSYTLYTVTHESSQTGFNSAASSQLGPPAQGQRNQEGLPPGCCCACCWAGPATPAAAAPAAPAPAAPAGRGAPASARLQARWKASTSASHCGAHEMRLGRVALRRLQGGRQRCGDAQHGARFAAICEVRGPTRRRRTFLWSPLLSLRQRCSASTSQGLSGRPGGGDAWCRRRGGVCALRRSSRARADQRPAWGARAVLGGSIAPPHLSRSPGRRAWAHK